MCTDDGLVDEDRWKLPDQGDDWRQWRWTSYLSC